MVFSSITALKSIKSIGTAGQLPRPSEQSIITVPQEQLQRQEALTAFVFAQPNTNKLVEIQLTTFWLPVTVQATVVLKYFITETVEPKVLTIVLVKLH